MSMSETFDQLLEEGNGFLQTSVAVKNGISRHAVLYYAQKRKLQKVAHGIYMGEDAWPDVFYLLFLRNKRIIFSGSSALFLHGMTDREPFHMTVSVHDGYNVSHLTKQGIKVIHVKPEWFCIGETEITTNEGNTVHVYDKERTICDLIRNRKQVDIQTFHPAMKEYMSGKKILPNLMRYSKEFQIEDAVRLYTEVCYDQNINDNL